MTREGKTSGNSAHAVELLRHLKTTFDHCQLTGVEVGAGNGATSEFLLREIPSLQMTLVDCWCSFKKGSDYWNSGDRCSRFDEQTQRQHHEEAQNRVRFAQGRGRLLQAYSLEAAGAFENESVDFAFIDADHTFEAVDNDLKAWWPRVKPGGVILGKDYGHRRDSIGQWGISDAVHAFAERHKVKVYCEGARVWRIDKRDEDDLQSQTSSETRHPCAESPLAVCTAYFNPAGYRRLKENYRRFRQSLCRQNVQLWTVEVAFGDAPYQLSADEVALQLRADSVLWQKEAALNLLVKSLPIHFEKIAWVDADLIFCDDNWTHHVVSELDNCPVIQCFSEAAFLDKDHRVIFPVRSSLARARLELHPYRNNFGFSHPGFAWAARRDWLIQGGLFENHVTGGGDSLMVLAWLGLWEHPHMGRLNVALIDSLRSWRERFGPSEPVEPGFVRGCVEHLWHGEEQDRLYSERLSWLADHQFNPETDLEKNESGLLEWRAGNSSLAGIVADYFHLRRDDG